MTGPRPFKKFIFKDYFRDPIEKFSGIINLSQNEIFINFYLFIYLKAVFTNANRPRMVIKIIVSIEIIKHIVNILFESLRI